MNNKSNILLIYTGGTIGMIKDFETGALRNFNFDELLEHIPELQHLDCVIHATQFARPIDSSNMNPAYWVALANLIEKHYSDYDGFIVLHGSDTMSYTASTLSFLLENLAKPIIFTGSQLPIGDLRTDAKENLITSIQLAALRKKGRPHITEVCLYFEYKLYRANRTTKLNAEHFQAFASMNYPPLAESGVNLTVRDDLLLRPGKGKRFKVHKELEKGILLIKLFPGMDPDSFEYLLKYPNLKGLVLETYGSGNAPNQAWLLDEIRAVLDRKIPVINVTQCSGGSVVMGVYETSSVLKRIGVISGRDITTEAALAKLMFLLGQGVSPKGFKTIFETPLRGEMS